MCERELSDIDCVSILGFEREYLDGLLEVAAERRPGQHLLVLFLGSTIGNFDRMAGLKFPESGSPHSPAGRFSSAGHRSGEAEFPTVGSV